MPRRKKGLAIKLQREEEERERQFQEKRDRQLHKERDRQLHKEQQLTLQIEKERELKERQRQFQKKEKAQIREEKTRKRRDKQRVKKVRREWANWHAPQVGDRVLYAGFSYYGDVAYQVTGVKTGKSVSVRKIGDSERIVFGESDPFMEACRQLNEDFDASEEEEPDDTLTLSWEEAIFEPSSWEFESIHRPMFICNPFCRHLEKEYPEGAKDLLNRLIRRTFVMASRHTIYSKKRCRDGKKCQDKRVGHLVHFSHV